MDANKVRTYHCHKFAAWIPNETQMVEVEVSQEEDEVMIYVKGQGTPWCFTVPQAVALYAALSDWMECP